jgi:hypothetical protein
MEETEAEAEAEAVEAEAVEAEDVEAEDVGEGLDTTEQQTHNTVF